MKEIFYIKDTPAGKISYYLLLVFVTTLPFDRIYSELALIVLLLHTLIHLKKENLSWSVRWIGWMSAALYLLTMAGTLYTARAGDAWGDWEKQLALVLFPLIIWFSRLDWQWYRPRLLKAFAFSCLFTAIYLYGVTLYAIYSHGESLSALFSKPHMNHAFSFPIQLHATYYAAYLALSVVVFADRLFRRPAGKAVGVGGTARKPVRAGERLVRLGYSLAVLICLCAIFQLASRAVCIALVVIANLLIPFYLLRGRLRWRILAIMVSLTMLSLLVVWQNSHLHSRYLVQLKQDLRSDTGAILDPEPRMARWQCAWELIRESPWIGYGTGAEVGKLKERYYAHHLMISYTLGLNAHNQFLSFWLKTGVVGMLVYVTALLLAFREAWRRKEIYLTAFVLIITCISLSENILDVNKGIFFFSMFFVIFLPKPVCIPRTAIARFVQNRRFRPRKERVEAAPTKA
ncbi:MAG TPA: O-antigen ligase family protein [Puia sp.]|nr:O-antigen ligase family protein [Puia sp.]